MPANNIPVTDIASARSLCWSCRQDVGSGPFCKHCVKIQPVDELGNYFTLFGLPKTFDLQPDDLRKKFFELSRKFHPDFYSAQTKHEKVLARNNTAYLNAALKTLSDPIMRAEYLLSLLAGSFSSNPAPPQELFEEILEIGELLSSQSLTDDHRARLVRAREAFQMRQNELTDSLSGLFSKLAGGDKDVKSAIVACLDQIKYLRRTSARIVMALMK